MSHTTFETEPSENSCGYCQFHGGFLWKQNIKHRKCIYRRCRWLILFTKHPDYEGFGLWEEDHVQRYRGSPFKFLKLYGDLLGKPQARDEDDEPDFNVEYADWKKDSYQAFRRRVRTGMARQSPNPRKRFREKRSRRKERDDAEIH